MARPLLLFSVLVITISCQSFGQVVASADPFSPDFPPQQSVETLKQALFRLEAKYNVSFMYKGNLLDEHNDKVVVKDNKVYNKIEEELQTILEPFGLYYQKVRDNFYLIESVTTKKKETNKQTSDLFNERSVAYSSSDSSTTASLETQLNFLPDIAISGKVTDADTGDPLPGVNVIVLNTSIGTVTDADGMYSINVPSEEDVLVFSFIGFERLEIPVRGKTRVDVSLSSSIKELDEVVVTALGFKEDRDKLATTSSKVDGNQLVRSGETGIIDALSGKASGVRIARSSGDPGAGSHILIRGQSSIERDLQPLIILDGIPIDNSSGTSTEGTYGQSRLNDINPDDIERIDVLKGASAAALWGTRAAMGVINITTKQGAQRDKLNISFRSTYSIDEINVKHPLQNSFGQGRGGVWRTNTNRSWGDRIADRSGEADIVDTEGGYFLAESGAVYYPVTQKNSRETFLDSNFDHVFRRGYFLDNSLSLSGGDDRNKFFLSLSDLNQKGIIRNNSDLRRTTIRFNGERKFNDVVRIQSRSNFIRTSGNAIRKGNSSSGLGIGLLRNPPDFDITDFKGTYVEGTEGYPDRQRSYNNQLGEDENPNFNNPRWTINEQINSNLVNRFITSAQIDVTPVDWMELIARGGVDTYWETTSRYFPPNTVNFIDGLFDEDFDLDREFNMDLMARFKTNVGDNISGSFLTGFNVNDRKRASIGGEVRNLIVTGLEEPFQDFSNATVENTTISDSESHLRTLGWYNQLSVGLWDMVFVDATARFETASTFGQESDPTFFFPSLGVAWQFTDLDMFKGNSTLSFGKLRASAGIVGIQPDSYRTVREYISPTYTDPFGRDLSVALYGNGGFVPSTNLNNPFLIPERKEEYEIGADLRFLENRLSVSATYYQNKTTDALFGVGLAASSGYTELYGNYGSIENRGWEVDLGYNLLKKSDFSWDVYANWNRNRNTVLDLNGVDNINIGGLSGVSNRVVKGYQHGILWGNRWERDENGALLLDENGFPQEAATQGVVGDPNPEWRGAFGSNFRYKGFSLNVLFETSFGGDMAAGTLGALYSYGTHQHTAVETVAPFDVLNADGDVIPAGTTFRGTLQDFGAGPVALDEAWYDGRGGYFDGPIEQFIFDASWTKLREVSLGYTLRSKGFRSATKLESVQFSVTGRNLLLWTDFVGLDPETNLAGPSSGRGIDYFNNPGTRSYLFSIRINY